MPTSNEEITIMKCPCTYPGCKRRGNCEACVAYHKDRGELPACYFSPEDERTFDRSIENFIRINNDN